MNSVNLIGNLTADPELKFTPGKGTAVVKCSLAIKRDKENTDFPRVVIWGKAAETVANYCLKGSRIGIEGSIKTGSYENKEGKKVYTTEVHTMKIHLLGSKKDGQANTENYDPELIPVDDGDIPF